MKTVTLDSTVVDTDHRTMIDAARRCGFDVAVTSVTEREGRSWIGPSERRLRVNNQILESAVLGESELGQMVFAPEEQDLLEQILRIIGHGSFPKQDLRDDLSPGHRRHLRDAIILLTHVRERRDIFVSDDANAFIDDGRREQLEQLLSTHIMTSAEFLSSLVTSPE